eukprot:Rhum_TRINITY_DN18625_c0_g1::Rhum_TRINITY_DN18625_c0_g1_i1::g.167950::m.167950
MVADAAPNLILLHHTHLTLGHRLLTGDDLRADDLLNAVVVGDLHDVLAFVVHVADLRLDLVVDPLLLLRLGTRHLRVDLLLADVGHVELLLRRQLLLLLRRPVGKHVVPVHLARAAVLALGVLLALLLHALLVFFALLELLPLLVVHLCDLDVVRRQTRRRRHPHQRARHVVLEDGPGSAGDIGLVVVRHQAASARVLVAQQVVRRGTLVLVVGPLQVDSVPHLEDLLADATVQDAHGGEGVFQLRDRKNTVDNHVVAGRGEGRENQSGAVTEHHPPLLREDESLEVLRLTRRGRDVDLLRLPQNVDRRRLADVRVSNETNHDGLAVHQRARLPVEEEEVGQLVGGVDAAQVLLVVLEGHLHTAHRHHRVHPRRPLLLAVRRRLRQLRLLLGRVPLLLGEVVRPLGTLPDLHRRRALQLLVVAPRLLRGRLARLGRHLLEERDGVGHGFVECVELGLCLLLVLVVQDELVQRHGVLAACVERLLLPLPALRSRRPRLLLLLLLRRNRREEQRRDALVLEVLAPRQALLLRQQLGLVQEQDKLLLRGQDAVLRRLRAEGERVARVEDVHDHVAAFHHTPQLAPHLEVLLVRRHHHSLLLLDHRKAPAPRQEGVALVFVDVALRHRVVPLGTHRDGQLLAELEPLHVVAPVVQGLLLRPLEQVGALHHAHVALCGEVLLVLLGRGEEVLQVRRLPHTLQGGGAAVGCVNAVRVRVRQSIPHFVLLHLLRTVQSVTHTRVAENANILRAPPLVARTHVCDPLPPFCVVLVYPRTMKYRYCSFY